MILLTAENAAKSAPKRWENNYRNDKSDDKVLITKKLNATINPTPKEINEIIGNSTWTSEYCDCCNKEVTVSVELEIDSNFSSIICKHCLEKALLLINN